MDRIIFEIDIEGGDRKWYAADVIGTSNSCVEVCKMPSSIPISGTPVILGSCIYYLGGRFTGNFSNFYSSQVFVFDVQNPDKGWIQGSSMNAVRLSPAAVSVHGRIYVFGGHDYMDFPKAEVFHPNSNSWEPIFFPPLRPRSIVFKNNFTVLGIIGREILVHLYHLHNKLFLFNVDTELWELKDNNFSNDFTGSSSVLTDDNVLYHYGPEGYVKGYDLVECSWLSNSFKIDAETNDKVHLVTLRHGGFGLVCSTALFDGDGKMNVMLQKFEVHKFQTQLDGMLGSSTSFVIEGVGLLSHVFAL